VRVEIREVDQERGIIQITAPDERFYARQIESADGPIWDYVPSVTWIANHYPKGIGFSKWLAEKGWDEAEAIKRLAGDKGSKVHAAVKVLNSGGTVAMEDAFAGGDDPKPQPLNPKEYFCLMTYCEWFAEESPIILDCEYTVWNERYRYAGTVDLKCRLKSTDYKIVHLIDLKTSPRIWPSMKLQLAAYKHADPSLPKGARLGILQVGYEANKFKKWKYTPVGDQFELFLAARKIWIEECADAKPFQREYPLSLSLGDVMWEGKAV
jgi:hypothetical protein